MKKVLKIIGSVFLGIIAALLFVLLIMFTIPLFEGNLPGSDVQDVSRCENWMADIEDSTPINTLSIPGCHDAGTQYVQLAFFSKCQGRSIYSQLKDGYRYLDIRLGINKDKEGNAVLNLMHGFTFCRKAWCPWAKKLTFNDVAEQCIQFLKENPTETIVFVVKQEHGKESVSEFQEELYMNISQYDKEYWYLENKIPSMEECRGKIVLCRRYEDKANFGNEAGLALIWKNQPGFNDVSLNMEKEQNENCVVYVQDRYEYEAADKWNAFETSNTKVLNVKDENSVFINFLSTKGNAKFGHPFRYAQKLNRRLMKTEVPDFMGWVVLDFGSKALASKIYSCNF